jgi:hypothetical protein
MPLNWTSLTLEWSTPTLNLLSLQLLPHNLQMITPQHTKTLSMLTMLDFLCGSL